VALRRLLERTTGWRFPKARPVWPKGRSRSPLELDGYNEKHQVAFEYQGEQHYRAKRFGQAALAATRRRDERKRQLCRRHGVQLIRVPYWKLDVEQFIRSKLEGLDA
jgi:hypothetical protein